MGGPSSKGWSAGAARGGTQQRGMVSSGYTPGVYAEGHNTKEIAEAHEAIVKDPLTLPHIRSLARYGFPSDAPASLTIELPP